jgi:hypothetical protein
LAQFLRESGPESQDEEEGEEQAESITRGASSSSRTRSASNEPTRPARLASPSSAYPRVQDPMTGVFAPASLLDSSLTTSSSVTSTPAPKAAKRWTIGGMSSLLNAGGPSSASTSPQPRAAAGFPSSSDSLPIPRPRPRRTSASAALSPRDANIQPSEPTSITEPTLDSKRREHRPSLLESELPGPSIPSSSQERREHPSTVSLSSLQL